MITQVFNMLKDSALADKSKALLSLELLSNHAVGIGDHSTADFYKNAEEALTMLVDADVEQAYQHLNILQNHP